MFACQEKATYLHKGTTDQTTVRHRMTTSVIEGPAVERGCLRGRRAASQSTTTTADYSDIDADISARMGRDRNLQHGSPTDRPNGAGSAPPPPHPHVRASEGALC